MRMYQLERIWATFMNLVREIDEQAAHRLVNHERTFFQKSNSMAHASPSQILKRLFPWGVPGSSENVYWHKIYIALGGKPLSTVKGYDLFYGGC